MGRPRPRFAAMNGMCADCKQSDRRGAVATATAAGIPGRKLSGKWKGACELMPWPSYAGRDGMESPSPRQAHVWGSLAERWSVGYAAGIENAFPAGAEVGRHTDPTDSCATGRWL
jgi:hypothetical protein